MATQPWNSIVYEDDTEIAIIGGGVCGTILAGRCAEQNIDFAMIDRQATLGGVWLEYANQHSSLQVSAEPVTHKQYSMEHREPSHDVSDFIKTTHIPHLPAVPRDNV